jgi:chromosome segregation ATPase
MKGDLMFINTGSGNAFKSFFSAKLVFTALLIMFIISCTANVHAVDLEPGDDTAQSQDPQLQKALGHLARAIAMKQNNDIDAALSEYMKGVSVSPEITKYNDQGIVLEIIRKYEKSVSNHNTQSQTAQQADSEQIKTLKERIEALEKDNSTLTNDISNLRDELAGKDAEYEEQIKELNDQIEKLDHMRAVYKGRWLRNKD